MKHQDEPLTPMQIIVLACVCIVLLFLCMVTIALIGTGG